MFIKITSFIAFGQKSFGKRQPLTILDSRVTRLD